MRLHNIIVRLLILALYKLAAGCRQCVNPTMQACAKTRISNLIAATNRYGNIRMSTELAGSGLGRLSLLTVMPDVMMARGVVNVTRCSVAR